MHKFVNPKNPYFIEQCVICCSEFQKSEKVVQLKCLHLFHKSCIQAWLSVNETCPIDRITMQTD